jgi:thiol-disulfide isomerase/thioredoxin
MSNRFALLIATVSFALPAAFAQTPAPAPKDAAKPERPAVTLFVGDKAPALAIEKWVKGDAVPTFQPGKVYMVEFWATWCGPCIKGMPHLSELQKKYKDQGFTVIGVSSKDSRGNTLEKVEQMVEKKADGMGYTVAWDKDRTTSDAYMLAGGQDGIPCCFVVDQNGVIAYIGHPMAVDETLEKVIAKKHDIKALAAAYKKAKDNEIKAMAIQQEMNEAAQADDWATVVKGCDSLLALDAKQFGPQIAPAKFSILANQMSDVDKAYAFAKEYVTGVGKDDGEGLNGLAWLIVDPNSKLSRQDLPLALQIATRANEATGNKNAAILDTLARVYFLQGDLQKAVDTQTKAVELDKSLEPTLKEYKDALAKKTKG